MDDRPGQGKAGSLLYLVQSARLELTRIAMTFKTTDSEDWNDLVRQLIESAMELTEIIERATMELGGDEE